MDYLEQAKKNYFNLIKSLKVENLFREEYNKICDPKFNTYHLKRNIRMTYIHFLKEIGASIKQRESAAFCNISQIPKGRVFCEKYGGDIPKTECVPNSDPDICPQCFGRQDKNPKVSNSALSRKEELKNRRECVAGMSQFGKICEDAGMYIE